MERRLTKLQAFNAMVKFLEGYYKETASDFMGGLLGALLFLPDGDTADPAFWEDWGIAIKKILHEQNSEKHVDDEILGISVTESQAFKAIVQFFRHYYKPDPDDPEAIMFFDYLHLLPDDNSSSLTIKEKWKTCVDDALKEKPGTREYLILGGG